MPLPKTSDVGKIMRFLHKEHPDWDLERRRAAALRQARKYGADIPPPKKTRRGKKRR